MRRSLASILPVVLLYPALAIASGGREETLFCADPATNTVREIDFDDDDTTAVNTDASSLGRLLGLSVRDDVDDVQIVAADGRKGRVLFYDGEECGGATCAAVVVAQGLTGVSSVTSDAAGHLYLTGGRRGFPIVWTIRRGGSFPGGYGKPIVVDATLRSLKIAQAQVYPAEGGGILARDLFVLAQTPPVLYRYPRGTGTFGKRKMFLPARAFPAGGAPTGLAFAPNGHFLIATTAGRVLRFDRTGARLADFATGLPVGRSRITVGIQDGVARAFVLAGGQVFRYTFQPGGAGVLDGSLVACSASGDLSLGSGTGAPTQTGSGVKVSGAEEVEIEFDDVSSEGLTRTRFVEFADNRSSGTGQGLKAFFAARPAVQALVPDVFVPAHIQAFPKRLATDPAEGPYTGPPTFIMALVDTTASFRRTAQFHEEEADRLGWAPSCTDPDKTMRPRTFYAPEPDEPQLVEGAVFTDFSTGCGSNIGRGSNFSLWLTARDTRGAVPIAADKFQNLQTVMDDHTADIEDTLESTLDGELDAAATAFANTDRPGAVAHLQNFIAAADGNPSGFTDSINLRGHVAARALSIIFMIGQTL